MMMATCRGRRGGRAAERLIRSGGSSDLKDLFILLTQRVVDPFDVVIGQVLDVALQLALLVLGNFAILFEPAQRLDPVLAYLADRHARLLGILGRLARQLAPPLLVQLWDGN